MKKLFLISLLLGSIILTGCSVSKTIKIEKPIEYNISKVNNYSLDCKTEYYTSILIGGDLIDETYIKVKEWHERDTLYIEWRKAKFFGSDFEVMQDNQLSLIILRNYTPSGLTEIVTINKETGIGFDTKTLASSISWGPNSDTYILSCSEI